MIDPLVTVVVPIFNVEKYLDRCLSAIVSQTYRNLEIILVDDGSPDQCPQMCDEWEKKDDRIKVIHKQNAGLGMARNSGIEQAGGEFIFFFDSDDYIASDAVEKCISAAQENRADTVLFSRNEVYPDGRIEKVSSKITKNLYDAEEITGVLLPGLYTYRFGYGVSAWSKMFSMEIIRENNLRFYSEREIVSEDAVFCLEYFSKASRVALLEDALYFYFRNDKSLSRSYRPDRQLRNDEFIFKSVAIVRQLGLPEAVSAHLESRYQMYSVAAMKQILAANLPLAEKKTELRRIYRSNVLRSTARWSVMRVTPPAIAVFMLSVKLRLYFLCDFMLKVKSK